MRILGWTLVVLAFACGPLGVQLEPSASLSEASCGEPTASVCEAPDGAPVEANGSIALPAGRGDFIPLNTRGYNYARPGEYRPRIPSATDPADKTPAQ